MKDPTDEYRQSILGVIKDAAAAQNAVTITLPEDVADALCCYLDDEDVFPEVVDLLLKAIPVPAPAVKPIMGINHETIGGLRMRTSLPNFQSETFDEFSNAHPLIVNKRDNVFQIVRLPHSDTPVVEGYNTYNTPDNCSWFDEYPPNGAEVIGYWHHYSFKFLRSNKDMIHYLRTNGYIN